MTGQLTRQSPLADVQSDPRPLMQLVRDASIELNVQDLKHLEASRPFLLEGKRIYVSHLPNQTWEETLIACREVSSAGFDPIPHVPVRLLESRTALERFVDGAVRRGRVNELLLVAGDSPQSVGPYKTVADVLSIGVLNAHGIRAGLSGWPP